MVPTSHQYLPFHQDRGLVLPEYTEQGPEAMFTVWFTTTSLLQFRSWAYTEINAKVRQFSSK